MVTQESEANARVHIDKALETSGWNLLDPRCLSCLIWIAQVSRAWRQC